MPIRFKDFDLRSGVREETRQFLEVHRSEWNRSSLGIGRQALTRICLIAGFVLLIGSIPFDNPQQKSAGSQLEATPGPAPLSATLDFQSKISNEDPNYLILEYYRRVYGRPNSR